MFFVCFLGFTLIFTLFENILLASISLVLVLIFLLLYQSISTKKIHLWRAIVFVVVAFVVAGVSFGVKETRYYGTRGQGLRDRDEGVETRGEGRGNRDMEQGTRTNHQSPVSTSQSIV